MKRSNLAVLLTALLPTPLSAQDISVRSGMHVSDQAEIELDRIAEPVTITLLPGVDPLAAAKELCGSTSPTYRKLLTAANPPGTLAISDARRTVKFPACFVVSRNLSVPVIKGETLKSFADRTVGLSGKRTVSNLLRWNMPLGDLKKSASGVDASAMILDVDAFSALTVPNATQPAIYSLRPEAAQNPQTAVEGLREASNLVAAPEQVDLKDELWLESNIPAPGIAVPCTAASTRVTAANWPFDAAALREALLRNDRHRQRVTGDAALDKTILAVADNGIDGFGTLFPKPLFKLNLIDSSENGVDEDQNDFPDDVYGTSVMMRGRQPIVLGGKDPWHGTHMTGLAVGGLAFRQATEAIGAQPVQRLQLIAIGMVQQKTSPTAAGINLVSYPMPNDAVNEAFDYARKRQAHILSLSVSTPEKQTILFGKLSGQEILLVAAAGNWATRFSTGSLRYPAAFGGVPSMIMPVPVVSVAAHDSNGCLASFSGRGERNVDLAAPGTDLLSNDVGGATRIASGTSQATAITAFAAALVRAEGVHDPMRVKFRLIASADPQPGLEGHVFARGSLNIRNAISRYDDILQLRGEPEQDFGTITPRITPAMACNDLTNNDRGEVLKVWRAPGSTPLLRVLVYFANGNLEYRTCVPARTSFHFESATGGVSRDFDVMEAANLIPSN